MLGVEDFRRVNTQKPKKEHECQDFLQSPANSVGRVLGSGVPA